MTEFRLIVDESLEDISNILPIHYTCWFDTQKRLEEISKDHYRRQRPHKEIADVFKEFKDTARGKMVITFDDRNVFVNPLLKALKSKERQKVQEEFLTLKKHVRMNELVINSLGYYIDICLRKIVILNYYNNVIYPKIPDSIITLNNIQCANAPQKHIKSGHGFIGGFKKKLLIDFSQAEVYWIKLLYSPEIADIVNQNVSNDATTKVFMGLDGDPVRTIDIFTNEKSNSHLFNLMMKDDVKAFIVDITPLITLLNKFKLLHCIEADRNWGKTPKPEMYSDVYFL